MMEFRFLHASNFLYLTKGLSLDRTDWEILDRILIEFNDKNDIVRKIVSHNQVNSFSSSIRFKGSQYIIELNKYMNEFGRPLSTALVKSYSGCQNMMPVVHINLHSPSLNIPQRVEIPLRYILNGAMTLENTFMVYLHVLEINNAEKFLYYGITKRGWMKRFKEHVRLALKGNNERKFPQLLGESMRSRLNELLCNLPVSNSLSNKLTGSHHVVCVAGRTSKEAHQIEKCLIDKYSLFNNHGLNMKSGTSFSSGEFDKYI